MKLRIFYADKGDCLLLTSGDGKSILVDGGMPAAFEENVAPRLRGLLGNNGKLDVVYISHIDEDHIGGVLKLLDHALEWRVHELHVAAGDANFSQPDVPQPPPILNLWHNAFHELIGENAGDVRDLLAASALGLRLVDAKWARGVGAQCANLANSMPQAIQVSRRVGSDQLDIPLNQPAQGKLMMRRDNPQAIKLGKLRVSILAPAKADLDTLRKDWNDWLRKPAGKAAIKKIRKEAGRDEDRLRSSLPERDAEELILALKTLGNRKQVTPPNLASLMLLVEEDGRSILLTGDGHSDDVEKGLEHVGKLQQGQGLHVDVLKVPHHGSEHNTTKTFPRRVTADHYVFCGNGFATNPELDVIRAYLDSRLGSASQKSANQEVDQPFHFWFSCTAALAPPKYRKHMKKVEDLVKTAAQGSGGSLTLHFLEDDPLEVQL